jgi:hypothetical protein
MRPPDLADRRLLRCKRVEAAVRFEGAIARLMPYADRDEWSCADGWLLVHFGDDGTAEQVRVLKDSPPTLTERIRRWLGL